MPKRSLAPEFGDPEMAVGDGCYGGEFSFPEESRRGTPTPPASQPAAERQGGPAAAWGQEEAAPAPLDSQEEEPAAKKQHDKGACTQGAACLGSAPHRAGCLPLSAGRRKPCQRAAACVKAAGHRGACKLNRLMGTEGARPESSAAVPLCTPEQGPEGGRGRERQAAQAGLVPGQEEETAPPAPGTSGKQHRCSAREDCCRPQHVKVTLGHVPVAGATGGVTEAASQGEGFCMGSRGNLSLALASGWMPSAA